MSSAADTVNSSADLESKDSGTPRPNPVALEVIVNVTGTKANGQSSRELFSEETTTVLVFREGAVILLNAAVAVGQLVFLTNKRTNQEVVCQILRKRGYKPTTCYVELQFTEPRPDYWGVAFLDGQKTAAQLKIVEQVQAEEVTAEETETPVAPRTPEDVDQLKREVEALREQLKVLEKKNVEEAATKALAEAAAVRDAVKREAVLHEAEKSAQAPSTANAAKHKEELAPVNDPVPVHRAVPDEKSDLLMPAAKEKAPARRAVVGMALPIKKEQPKPQESPEPSDTHDAVEELLPQPELDFSQAPQAAADPSEVKKIRMPLLGSKTRVRALTAVLVVVALSAILYLKLWTYLPLSVRKTRQASGNLSAKAAAPAAHNTIPDGANSANPPNIPASSQAIVATASDSKDTKDHMDTAAEETTSSAKPTEHPAEVASKKPGAHREKSSRKNETATAAPKPDTAALPSDAPVLPAKLLKPANPVYPPEAMNNYITGDVKAEVEVDAQGHVSTIKVLSGPQALRDAAIQALKQYEYAPATQAGKPVPATSTEVVKFWFNP